MKTKYRILEKGSYFRAQKLIRGEWEDLEFTDLGNAETYRKISDAKLQIDIDIDKDEGWEVSNEFDCDGNLTYIKPKELWKTNHERK